MMTEGKGEGAAADEGDDAVWRLLERAPAPLPVSPYFARRVLREVAALEEARPAVAAGPFGWWHQVRQAWRWQGRATFACALVAVALLLAGGAGLSVPGWHGVKVPAIGSRVELPGPQGTATGAASPDLLEVGDPGSSLAAATVASDPVVTAQDVEVIADLDNVLSREESRLWTEDSTVRF